MRRTRAPQSVLHSTPRSPGKQRGRRRRRTKQQAAIKGLLLTAMVLGSAAKPKATPRVVGSAAGTEIRVSLGSFTPLPPYLAYDQIIEEAAALHAIDSALIHAVIEAESTYNALAESPRGAQGLMQLMPAVQQELGVLDPFDARQNIMAGTALLKQLLDRFHGDVSLALASYNAGPASVERFKGIPPFGETRRYVKKIQDLLGARAND